MLLLLLPTKHQKASTEGGASWLGRGGITSLPFVHFLFAVVLVLLIDLPCTPTELISLLYCLGAGRKNRDRHSQSV
jgi:hypothetical protein